MLSVNGQQPKLAPWTLQCASAQTHASWLCKTALKHLNQRKKSMKKTLLFAALGIAGMLTTLTAATAQVAGSTRSEEHTSELQSQSNLVCRLLLEKKKKTI